VRRAYALSAVLVLAACGSKASDPYAQANARLLDSVPVYPGAMAPKDSSGTKSAVEFAARDWTLRASVHATTVIAWYERRLPAGGWRITGKSFGTLRAVRGKATLAVGIRGRTLEAIANSRGA
jgi:hypothetical protein